MRTVFICHEGAILNQRVLPRWLNSFSELVGIIVLRETKKRVWQRICAEMRRNAIFFKQRNLLTLNGKKFPEMVLEWRL